MRKECVCMMFAASHAAVARAGMLCRFRSSICGLSGSEAASSRGLQ